ncbi:MAG: hypothetical protein AB8H80_02225 [Planctomycetota bacterium]
MRIANKHVLRIGMLLTTIGGLALLQSRYAERVAAPGADSSPTGAMARDTELGVPPSQAPSVPSQRIGAVAASPAKLERRLAAAPAEPIAADAWLQDAESIQKEVLSAWMNGTEAERDAARVKAQAFAARLAASNARR